MNHEAKIQFFDKIYTNYIVKLSSECCKNAKECNCFGDSGSILCFFCPKCVLSVDERTIMLWDINDKILKGEYNEDN